MRSSVGSGPDNWCGMTRRFANGRSTRRSHRSHRSQRHPRLRHVPPHAARAEKVGFKIAIDDCGSGYATLEAVAELVARCADTIGARTIAEAVETGEQLRVCQELGISEGQFGHDRGALRIPPLWPQSFNPLLNPRTFPRAPASPSIAGLSTFTPRYLKRCSTPGSPSPSVSCGKCQRPQHGKAPSLASERPRSELRGIVPMVTRMSVVGAAPISDHRFA